MTPNLMIYKVGFVLFLFLFSLLGCSTAAKRERANTVRSIHQLVPYNLRVRRPAVMGADPSVGPGGIDYRTDPVPNASFDCEPIEWLFREIKLDSLRGCLESIKTPVSVRYRLAREVEPHLYIQDPDEVAPSCLKDSLGKIPIPREIFFQSNEEGSLNCYGARLDIEADELLYAKVPMNKLLVRIEFPLPMIPKTDEEMRLLLFSWASAPFWKGEPKAIPSKILPGYLCEACLGKKNLSKESDPPPALWP